jgi:RNA recognition motif-containing protein
MLTSRVQITSAKMLVSQSKFAFSSENESQNTLFLQNCDVDTTEEDLRKTFGEYGNITKAFIMNRNRNIPAVGIVEFEDNEASGKAMAAL